MRPHEPKDPDQDPKHFGKRWIRIRTCVMTADPQFYLREKTPSLQNMKFLHLLRYWGYLTFLNTEHEIKISLKSTA